MESDWKKLGKMLPVWRERYLTDHNARIVRILTDPKKTETERFWDAKKQMQKDARTLEQCLDDMRRSTMLVRLWTMRKAGMIKREDLADFSQELQDDVFRDFS